MAEKRGFREVLIGVSILGLGLPAGAQTGGQFKARLSPVPIDAATASTIAGRGSVTAVLTGTNLSITGTFEGLRSAATVARLHNGPKGIRGPAVFDLTVTKATSGTISGTLRLTTAQVDGLKNGKFYVQIHSERAPEGNLWGWLLQ